MQVIEDGSWKGLETPHINCDQVKQRLNKIPLNIVLIGHFDLQLGRCPRPVETGVMIDEPPIPSLKITILISITCHGLFLGSSQHLFRGNILGSFSGKIR